MAKYDPGDPGSEEGGGEFSPGPPAGTAIISGVTFQDRGVIYADIGGVAIVEGDIALGTVEEVQAATEAAQEAAVAEGDIAFGVGITGSRFRWPNRLVPWDVDPNLPNQNRITEAIAHWQSRTTLRFVRRTAANAGQHPNYVWFQDDGQGGSWSMVGMQGNGRQPINLANWATTGTTIHEIGHAIGLWHEQSREDRDRFITIRWENIQPVAQHNFSQHITDGDDLGGYDYGSIMHYPRNAFTRNGQDTIIPKDPNAQIGQRSGLSAGDVAAVRMMYPAPVVVNPKKRRDDPGMKKRRDDEGHKMFADPRPFAARPQRTYGNGKSVPFSILTPHHGRVSEYEATEADGLAELEGQVLQLQAALAQLEATAAQATAEAFELRQACDAAAAEYQEALDVVGGP